MEALKLHDVLVYLVSAGIVIPIAKRFRISPVLGFLLIGLAVGPYGLARFADEFGWLRFALITDVAGVRALAELGVVFLLFMIGLELSLERLWAMRRFVLGLGSAQIVLTGGVIGAIAWGFGNSLEASVLLGSCLALSSTAIVMQLLIEQGRFGSTVGRASFAILLAQDIAVVPILFTVGAFGAHVGGSVFVALSVAFAQAAAAVILILGVGRLVIRPLFRFVGLTESPEFFMAVTLLMIIATAAATHAVGLSAALGAFLAGILLAETEFRHEIEIDIEPFKGLLLGLFFMSIAMAIDLAEVASEPLWVPLAVLGLFVIKAAIASGLARAFGFGWSSAAEMGLLLSQGGEFAFVVVALALAHDLMPIATGQFMLIVVSATMFLTPLVARVGRWLGEAIETHGHAMEPPEIDIAPDLTGHVIIVGYGRTGQLIAAMLDRQSIPHVALDLDADRVAELHARGAPVFLGDASRSAMLRRMRLDDAAALVVCMNDHGATEHVLAAAQRVAPEVAKVARARDSEHAISLLSEGADRVVPEVLESGLQLGHVLLEEVGLPPQVARELTESERSERMLALPSEQHRTDPSQSHEPPEGPRQ